MLALVSACGGGGGGGAITLPGPTPSPTPIVPTTTSVSAAVGVQATGTFAALGNGYGGSVTVPGTTSGSGAANLELLATDPIGVAVSSSARLPKAIGVSLVPLAYVTVTPTTTLTFAAFPAFTFVVPASAGVTAADLYVAWYNPNGPGWTTLAGPAVAAGSNTYAFAAAPGPVTLAANTAYAFVLLSTAQTVNVPSPAPTAIATTTSVVNAFACPTTGTVGTGSIARLNATGESAARFHVARHAASGSAPNLLAVTYDRSTALASMPQIAAREGGLGLQLLHSYDYPSLNVVQRVVSVPSGQLAQAEATLRAQAGVRSVALTGERRYPLSSSAYYTNDPYFTGFAPNFETLPYAENANVPGQWDMHAIGLEHAFGYVNGGTGVAANANALGSTAIKIAIIDTGEDASHPELTSQIAYQRCFITNPNPVPSPLSTGIYSTDTFGHGTDVSGIAAAASGNALGFTGAGGKAVIYAYRVFPTPDDTCEDGQPPDERCGADTSDIASAIGDAVTQGVNVISMSLGGGGCSNGQDTDTTEGTAIANAISHNVVVVAAAGNAYTNVLDAPACDPGVIAVGATGLDDGQPTGTSAYTTPNAANASAGNVVEYVTSYSQYGSPGSAVRSATAWGIVAPGGDPGNGDFSGAIDNLHWIQNIWTSTPYEENAGDQNFAGNCVTDYPIDSPTGAVDCRTFIAGTSMATPHVAGAAALILAVTGGRSSPYQTPSAMKQLLCQTADDLADSHEGCGRLNVYRAMATVLGDTNPP